MSAIPITVEVTGPVKYLNANRALHWSEKARLTRAWRAAASAHTRAVIGPRKRPLLKAATLSVVVVFPDARRRDAHNVSLKAAIDGAIDARILSDDDDERLISVTVTSRITPKARPALIMTWTPAPTPPEGTP